MPPKKGPKILVDVFEEAETSKPKKMGGPKPTIIMEQHTSYDITGEKTITFMPVPVSPAKRRATELSGLAPDAVDTVLEQLYTEKVTPLTEDEIEQGIDESRLLELEGLGHLVLSPKMRTSRTGPAPAHKKKAARHSEQHCNRRYLLFNMVAN